MAKSNKHGETKIMGNGMKLVLKKGETTMAKTVAKVEEMAAKAETKAKGETKMGLKEQVLALLKKMDVVEVATTRKGTKYNILDCTDCKEFWDLWKEHKEDVRALGIAVTKKDGLFVIRDFTALNYDCSKSAKAERNKANLEKGRAVKAEHDKERRAKVAQKFGLSADTDSKELSKINAAYKVLKDAGFID